MHENMKYMFRKDKDFSRVEMDKQWNRDKQVRYIVKGEHGLEEQDFLLFYMCYMCFCQYHWYEVIFHWFYLHFPDYKGCKTLVCFHFGVTSVVFRVLLWTLCLQGIRGPCVLLGIDLVLTVCKTITVTIVLLLQTWQHFSIYILTITSLFWGTFCSSLLLIFWWVWFYFSF